MKPLFLLTALLYALVGCTSSRELPTVDKVDLTRYAGKWYEIARLPNRFEEGLECVTANYTLLENGEIEVLNKGYYTQDNSQYKTAKGQAMVPDPNKPGEIKVTFFRPFYGDYFIIALDKDYRYALVGAPSRDYLWILSREKVLDQKSYDYLIDIAQKNGFDTSKLEMIRQHCDQ